MGEAKRRREAQAASGTSSPPPLDLDKLSAAMRQTVQAITDQPGADCLIYARVGAVVLRRLGHPARAVAGSAAWRVGPGDSDVVSHAREVNGDIFLPDAPVPAAMFHAWIEVGHDPATAEVVDFSTWTLANKARQLDEADGGKTQVDWCPDYLWIKKGALKAPKAVLQAPDAGVAAYVRHPDIEARLKFEDLAVPEDALAAAAHGVLMAYKALVDGRELRIFGVGDEGLQESLPPARYRPA